MEIGRRPVLQGFAATGIATVAGAFRSAADRSPVPSIRCALLTEATQGERFLAGARSAIDEGVIQETGSFDLDLLTRILASREQRLLLGLVDDGVAAIVVEMARDAGARLRWLGHHSVGGGKTRHRLLTASRGDGALFAEALDACDVRWAVTDCSLVGHKEEFSASGEIRVNPTTLTWAAALGSVLASAAAVGPSAQWPTAILNSPPIEGGGFGSFVSFRLEL